MRRILPLAALLAVLAACAGTEPGATANTTMSSTASSTTESDTSTMSINEQLPIVAPAIEDLAERLGVAPEEIEILAAEEVTWPDGSLGCPEPGMSYTQALVEGSKAVLRYEDRVFVYHAGDDDQPFLCPSDEKDGGHEMVPPPGYHD